MTALVDRVEKIKFPAPVIRLEALQQELDKHNKYLNAIYSKVNNIDIPKEIKILEERKNIVSFKDWTRWVMIVTFVFTAVFISVGILYYKKGYELKQEAKEIVNYNYTNEEIDYYNLFIDEFKKIHPKDTEKFIKNHPPPKGKRNKFQ